MARLGILDTPLLAPAQFVARISTLVAKRKSQGIFCLGFLFHFEALVV
jgi:hypothetical protein